MTRRLTLAPAARQDLKDIWHYIAQRDEAAANRMLDRLEERLRQLSEHSHLGPAREDIETGLRHLLVPPYLIFYRLERGAVIVGRIVDGRRDLSKL